MNAAKSSIPQSGTVPRRKVIPWWNPEIAEAIKTKKQALNKFKRQPTTDNFESFKIARSRARKIMIKSKKDTWNKYKSTITSDTDINEVWRKIKAIQGKLQKQEISNIQDVNGTVLNDPRLLAEVFADHFSNVSSTSNYMTKFREAIPEKERKLDFNTEQHLPYNLPFTIDELEGALSKAKLSAPGKDSITNDMLKNLRQAMKENVLTLFNQLWEKGVYPKFWKEATIIPILKPNKNRLLASNYRPISLTCCLGKLFERMVNHRLQNFLEQNNLLVIYQAGFRKTRSTTDQLVVLENYIQEAYRKREHAIAVFFDIKGAYDMTWKHGILQNLHDYGMRGNLPKFVKSFLSDRVFHVELAGHSSSPRNLENGVSQGSTLSCTLFAIAINSIAKRIENVCKSLYVDHVAFICSGKTVGEAAKALQKAIDKLSINASSIGFQFAVGKTVCVHFCRLRKPHYDPVLFINGQVIQCLEATKFLGLIFDRKLTWRDQIPYI